MSETAIRGTVMLCSIHFVLFISQIILVNYGFPGIPNYSPNSFFGALFTFNTNNQINGLSTNVSEALPQQPQTTTNTFGFIDLPFLLWKFFMLLLGFIIAPITIFLLMPTLNIVFSMFFIIFLSVLEILGWYFLVRGVMT